MCLVRGEVKIVRQKYFYFMRVQTLEDFPHIGQCVFLIVSKSATSCASYVMN
jgi:hypothetical protein